MSDFLANGFNFLVEVFDGGEENGLDFDLGSDGLDRGVELFKFAGKRLDGGPPRAYARGAEDELPRGNAKRF